MSHLGEFEIICTRSLMIDYVTCVLQRPMSRMQYDQINIHIHGHF